MESRELLLFMFSALSFFGGIIVGAVTATIKVSGVVAQLRNKDQKLENDVENNKRQLEILNNVIFQERGGLNVMTLAEHKELCGMHGEKLNKLTSEVTEMREDVQELKVSLHVETVKELIHSVQHMTEELARVNRGRYREGLPHTIA